MALPTAPPGTHVVTLEIDGHHLSARDDESIIEVCRETASRSRACATWTD